MAKRYYNLEKETKAFLKRMEETRGVLPDGAGIQRVNDYIVKRKGLGVWLGTSQKLSCRFVSTLSQSLIINSNATLQAGDIDFSILSFYKPSNISVIEAIVSKSGLSMGVGQREYAVVRHSSNTFRFNIRSDATASVAAISLPYTSLDWYCVHAFHDSTNDTLNIQVNTDAVVSTAHTDGIFSSTLPFLIGREGTGFFYNNGSVDTVIMHKRLLSTDEKNFLYNSKRGVSYLEILAYKPDILVDMVSFWSLNEGTGERLDSHGTNNLTPVNNPLPDAGITEDFF